MGFFSSIGRSLFGDQGKGAAKAQSAENQENREFIERQVTQARSEVVPLFEGAQQARTAGSQAALGVLGGVLPEQIGAFTQGNVGAQQALISGQPAFRSAILGTPAPQAQQPFQIDVNTGFIPTQLPQVQGPQQVLAGISGSPAQSQSLVGNDILRSIFGNLQFRGL